MKKFLVCMMVVVMFFCFGAATLTTRISQWRVLDTCIDTDDVGTVVNLDSDLEAASGFGVTKITGEVDLLSAYGAGSDTYANALVLMVKATGAADGDTLTQKIYGRCENGPPQLIASIVWTIGSARADGATDTLLWAEHAVVTTDYPQDVEVHGTAASNMPGAVVFDATGLRYIYSLFTAQTGDPTDITCLYRVY
jgi:hypothetical protein